MLWAPPCALMTLIFFASTIPASDISIRIWDKAMHFIVYGALGVLFLLPMTGGRWASLTLRAAASGVGLATLYGITDEIHQMFTPGRSPDVRDVIADLLGAGLAVGLIFLLRVVAGRGRGYTAS
jgi:VanZ family protein